MTRLIAWFKSKNLTAHITVASMATVAGIIKVDTDVQTLLFRFLKGHPNLGPTIILVAGIIFRYSKSSVATPENKS